MSTLGRYLALRDGEEVAVLGGLSAAVGTVVVALSDLPEGLEPVGVVTVAAIVFLSLVFALALARL
ncbi:MAG: hypothetical protein V5A30_05435 [Haloarculaceae archaeon]